ncbi:MAG TPA: IS630 family transposase [Actinomycetota bacterium]|nr:IS630 family transposase [Actinomycetota bacterium]
MGLPEEARAQPASPTPQARQGGERRGAGGVQKNLAQQVEERRAENPDRPVEVWAFDEHRVGPKPIARRQWAPIGQRPIALGQHRFEWPYVYGFVHPGTGEVVWFLCNGVSTVLLSAVLAAFATAVGAGPDKLVVLVLDNAGWHSSEQLVVPDGLRLAFLPPYSPELQPAGRLWPLTNEAVANQGFATLKELDEALGKRCCTLAGLPELIKGHTNYSWWPKPSQVTPALN